MYSRTLVFFLLFILFILVGVLLLKKTSNDTTATRWGISIAVSFVLTIVVMLSVFSHQEHHSKVVTETSYEEKQNILSVVDKNIQEGYAAGTFLLGTGTISALVGNVDVYNALVGTPENGYQMQSFETDSTYLFFDGDNKPFIRTRVETPVQKYETTWLNGGLFTPLEDYHSEESASYELHLPENTVKVKYDIDFE